MVTAQLVPDRRQPDSHVLPAGLPGLVQVHRVPPDSGRHSHRIAWFARRLRLRSVKLDC
ncbi:hypothetical protein GCM10007173_08360 [Glutamicibacter ardleyensis]|uniref:Uncharacterized protein n=1 Tax=Glutamicibacter ardleyensis TaxID=225894 RepID=A0ABQ2DEZ2_9MICC|nr:hypothetical protein GCM10007173_08360 [Glutamicibacter ardleyensis]